MKIMSISSLVVLLMMTSCNKESNPIDKYINKTDNVPISETLYIFEVDSARNITDTLGLRKLKYDDKRNLIFENNFQFKYKLETLNYYNLEHGLIYSKVKKDGKIFSDFRVNLQLGQIISADYNMYQNGIKDSIFMRYDYILDKGRKTKLLINSGDDFTTTEVYNDEEKPILSYSVSRNDTLDKTKFKYDKNNVLKQKRVRNLSRDEEIIYDYDKGFIVKESFLKSGVQKFITNYYKDKQGNYLSYTKMIKDTI